MPIDFPVCYWTGSRLGASPILNCRVRMGRPSSGQNAVDKRAHVERCSISSDHSSATPVVEEESFFIDCF